MITNSYKRPNQWVTILAATVSFWIIWGKNERVGLTFDEGIHIVGGLNSLQTGDFRLHPENGTLPQRWLALPWFLSGEQIDLTLPTWKTASSYPLTHGILEKAGSSRTSLLSLSRALNAVLGVVLILILSAWSHALWGRNGGVLTWILATFCPTILAHSSLATSDIACALGFILSCAAWWRLLHRVSLFNIFSAGLTTGALCLTKYSAILLPAILALTLSIRSMRKAHLSWYLCGSLRGRLSGKSRWLAWTTGSALACIIAWVTIWSAYGFCYEAASQPQLSFIKNWDEIILKSGATTIQASWVAHEGSAPVADIGPSLFLNTVEWLRDRKLLPEAWLYGLGYVLCHAQARIGYFAGDYTLTGSPFFYPLAWLLKATLASWILVACLPLFKSTREALRNQIYRLTPLIALIIVYGLVALTSHMNLGLRHLLPVIAATWIIAGAGVSQNLTKKSRVGISFILALLHASESLPKRPHYIGFFNCLAGPAYRHQNWFSDSNIDWGQGLPELADWFRQHPPDENIYLSYFGQDDPAWYDLPPNLKRFGDSYFGTRPNSIPVAMGPGLYIIGATQLTRVYTAVGGPWNLEREKLYRYLQGWLLNNRDDSTQDYAHNAWLFDELSFGRFCAYVDQRKPYHIIPGGLLIYRLDTLDAETAFLPPQKTSGVESASGLTPPTKKPADQAK